MGIVGAGPGVVPGVVRAPSQPGAYVLRLTVVQESVHWFDTNVDMTIDVL